MNPGKRSVTDLPKLICELSEKDRSLVNSMFDVRECQGTLIYPEDPVVINGYGPRELVEKQKIVKITNKITCESALFNELRSRRPFQTMEKMDTENEIKRTDGCIFCRPKAYSVTSTDSFLESGRIETNTCFTASNPGKYDGYHGLVIFNNHNPYSFENFKDYLNCSINWAKKAQRKDRDAIYFFFMWNCLWKAGGSMIHGHTQMSLGKGMHYGKIEYLLKAANGYSRGMRNYFNDLYDAHELLGLGFKYNDVKLMAYLTPIKEKEVVMISKTIDDLNKIVPEVLACFYSRLGARSFNLALICPPSAIFDEIDYREKERWNGFPIMIRMLDRGDLNNRTTDFGAMELYAASVISSDPYIVAGELKTCMKSIK